jgi:hypothetical protein
LISKIYPRCIAACCFELFLKRVNRLPCNRITEEKKEKIAAGVFSFKEISIGMAFFVNLSVYDLVARLWHITERKCSLADQNVGAGNLIVVVTAFCVLKCFVVLKKMPFVTLYDFRALWLPPILATDTKVPAQSATN